jgi:hypothetical protein
LLTKFHFLEELSLALEAAEASLLDPTVDFSSLNEDDDLLNYFLSSEILDENVPRSRNSLDLGDLMSSAPHNHEGDRSRERNRNAGLVVKSEALTSFASGGPLSNSFGGSSMSSNLTAPSSNHVRYLHLQSYG